MFVQVEGELRSREYEKDGVKRRIWECKAYRIAKLDRIERAEDNGRSEEAKCSGGSAVRDFSAVNGPLLQRDTGRGAGRIEAVRQLPNIALA